MTRLARVVVPGHPHLVTQRGNEGRRVFFSDADYAAYRDLLGEATRAADVAVWAWCLMPHHVQLVLTPADEDGLRRALARVHRQYAALIHTRRQRSGHFWQGRFGSVAMDEAHLAAAYRHVHLDPVRARLAKRPQNWEWSSARALLGLGGDPLTALAPARARYLRFADLLEAPEDRAATRRLREGESIGRPAGSEAFLLDLERRTGRRLRPLPRGPRPRALAADAAA